MEEQAGLVETPNRKGWPKGKKRGPRKGLPDSTPAIQRVIDSVPEPQAGMVEEPPVSVTVVLKGGGTLEFGASEHFVEAGFHVFIYPSTRNRYYSTRREIAISEIVHIDITEKEKKRFYDFTRQPAFSGSPPRIALAEDPQPPRESGRPVIHSAKDDIVRRLKEQADIEGPARISEIPEINRVKVSLGGSDG